MLQEMEQQRQLTVASDTRTITEAMLRKQLEAQHTKLAVSASTQYAINAKYVEVNTGRHPRVNVFPGMFNSVLDPENCGGMHVLSIERILHQV